MTACGGVAPCRKAVSIAGTQPGVRDAKTIPLTSADGSWSAMPISLVHPSVNAPSADVSPTAMPSAVAKASATA